MALFKTAYDGTLDDFTITLNALPSSSDLLVGRESMESTGSQSDG